MWANSTGGMVNESVLGRLHNYRRLHVRRSGNRRQTATNSLRDEVLRHRVMTDDCVRRLFRMQLEALGDRDTDALTL
jgi:hypothetical protein